MIPAWTVILSALAYLCVLFAIAHMADTSGRRLMTGRARTTIYALALGVYCTSWTFYGSVGFANRAGFEDGVGFWGGSEILDPSGVRLAKAKYYEPDLITAEINLQAARRQRIASPLLRDEDIDLTINELLRIRGRDSEKAGVPAAAIERRGTSRGARRAVPRKRARRRSK